MNSFYERCFYSKYFSRHVECTFDIHGLNYSFKVHFFLKVDKSSQTYNFSSIFPSKNVHLDTLNAVFATLQTFPGHSPKDFRSCKFFDFFRKTFLLTRRVQF